MGREPLLQVHGLRTYFYTEMGVVKAVEGVSFEVGEGETVALVGESGSGKTVTALSILRLIPSPGRIVGGKIFYRGTELTSLDESEMRKIRGKRIAMVFQDPSSSLDPLFPVGDQVLEVIRYHERISRKEAWDKVISLFNLVGIPEPENRIQMYPHELSGGLRQRVCIARALAAEPDILIADEPTTNLDVTIQAQVLQLMKDLRNRLGMSTIIITHDMGIVADLADKVVVLYAGNACEVAPTDEIFYQPRHPYTEALLASVPRLDKEKEMQVIGGNVPNLIDPPSGCRFHPRCPYMVQRCVEEVPSVERVGMSREVACHRWRELTLTGVA